MEGPRAENCSRSVRSQQNIDFIPPNVELKMFIRLRSQ